ncbi:MAG: CDP-alcohol phosphatidyltransferase family protein [Candidatus Aenigmarchaeota archaeon]|nr:CDP-alcohol phosphatidyltransferase family protein [Candidatus Aenigmarchaeota archaeon]
MILKKDKIFRKLIKKEDGFISRHLNRKISIPISLFIVRHNIPISANFMSFIAFICGMVGGVFFTLGESILGGVFVQIHSVLDGCDGELARIRGKSKFGEFIDKVFDRIAEVFIFFGIGYYQFLLSNSLSILLFTFGVVFYNLLRHYAYEIFIVIDKSTYKKISISKTKDSWIDRIYKRVRKLRLHQRDMSLFLIFIASFFNQQFKILILMFLVLLVNDVFFFFVFLRSKKE